VVNLSFTAGGGAISTESGHAQRGSTYYCGVTRTLAARFSLGRDSRLTKHSILACLQWAQGTLRSQRICPTWCQWWGSGTLPRVRVTFLVRHGSHWENGTSVSHMTGRQNCGNQGITRLAEGSPRGGLWKEEEEEEEEDEEKQAWRRRRGCWTRGAGATPSRGRCPGGIDGGCDAMWCWDGDCFFFSGFLRLAGSLRDRDWD
jgi:hypothetical protein